MSKARDLSNFISDATVDATEIADLAVTHAKLHTDMNLSSKTLTFAANQISGNSVDGGVISNFASTGIDDNASATAVTILSDGKVGIGTSSITSGFKTEINHSGETYGIKLTDGSGRNIRLGAGDCEISSTGSNFDIRTTDLRHLIFRTNNVPRMQIHADGHIGFGDNVINDSAWSTVFGARSQWDTKGVVAATDGSMQIGHNWYYDAAGTTGYKYIASGKANRMIHVDDYISWETTDTAGTAGGEITMTEKMRLSSSGKVGIGTTSPGQKLTVAGGIESTSAQGSVAFYSTTAGSYNQQNGTGGTAWAYGSTGGSSAPNTAASTTFGFHHWNGSAWSNPLNVLTSGNVGIGADTPENSLHIKNNTATNGQMIIQGDANNTYIRMNKSGSTWAIGIDASDSNKFKIGNNSDLSAGTRLTVTTSGKVLINTTDPQDDPSMLRVANAMANIGGVYIGKVHNSTNNNNAAVLLHRMGQGQGHQFSGKFIINSWTGNRNIDCHITSKYNTDAVTVNSNFTNSGGISQATVRLCTVNVGGVLYLAFVKDGGGTGVSYVNAFIEGNIHFQGGVREVLTAGSGYTVTTTHHTF